MEDDEKKIFHTDSIIISDPQTPTTYGEKGSICWDTDNLYVCTDWNTWKTLSLDGADYVPYTGATGNVNLGTKKIQANGFNSDGDLNIFSEDIWTNPSQDASFIRTGTSINTSTIFMGNWRDDGLGWGYDSYWNIGYSATDNNSLSISNNITSTAKLKFSNPIETTKSIISKIATGTSPYACTSTTLNTNLNADMVDGKHNTDFIASDNANFATLTNDSMADTLHRHSELSASDGTPNPALSVDASGNVGIGTTAPGAKLEVSGSASRIQIDTLSTSNGGLRVVGSTGTNSPSAAFLLQGIGTTPYLEISAGDNTTHRNIILNPNGGNVGIGTTAPGEKLEVTGNIQLTSDNNILKFGTAEDASITFDGNSLNIVANAVTATDALEMTAGNFQVTTASTDAGTTKNANYFSSTFTASSGVDAQTLRGVYFNSNFAGTQNFTGYPEAMEGSLYNTGSGTMTRAYGLVFSAGCLSTGSITTTNLIDASTYGTGAGKLTTIKGINIGNLNAYNDPTTTTGLNISANTTANASAVTKYGIYIGNISGAATNNYAIYSNGGQSYFAGNVGIGTTAPATHLDIDSNSNSECLRLRGADAPNEYADFYVDASNDLIIDSTGLTITNDVLKIAGGIQSSDGSAGITATITTAALTGGGSQGSMTFKNGILTAQTQAT
jgi:hypothetical protein